MEEKLLFQVGKNFSLPGLGVLLLPVSEVPALLKLPLHTALSVRLRYAVGGVEAAVATVEEIAHSETPPVRALLLAQDVAKPVSAGTEVWWAGTEVGWEELL